MVDPLIHRKSKTRYTPAMENLEESYVVTVGKVSWIENGKTKNNLLH